MSPETSYLIAYIFFVISLFLILREFFCWYWKINSMKVLMEEQRDIMMEQKELLKTIVFLEKENPCKSLINKGFLV